MSSRSVTIWTCEICAVEVILLVPSPPEGWQTIVPGGMASLYICEMCSTAIQELIKHRLSTRKGQIFSWEDGATLYESTKSNTR